MNARLHPDMANAMRLTRSGQLLEATEMIQRVLRGASPAPADAATQPIDGEFHVVDKEPATGPGQVPEPGIGSPFAPPPNPVNGAGLQELWRRFHRTPAAAGAAAGRDTGQAPGQFVARSYTGRAGARDYKLYIPQAYNGQPLPLVVMLHGCTQNPDDFAAGTRMNEFAETQPCLVVYPAQTPAANVSKCWNWFNATDQQRDQGEPSIIAGITREILDTYRLDRQRVYVAGLSAGGAMALTMAITYPDLYAAVAVHSGLPHGAARDLPSALMMMNSPAGRSPELPDSRPGRLVPTIVFHGDQDKTVHPGNGDRVIAQCKSQQGDRPASPEKDLRPKVERGQVPHGHGYTRTIYQDGAGVPVIEQWSIHGAGHAWSGGSARGSYTDSKGPDATREMLRFFQEHPRSRSS